MTPLNLQLQAFYKAQGLTGKHLRKALQYDRRAVRRAIVEQNLLIRAERVQRCHLGSMFLWSETREGHWYWSSRDLDLFELI